MKRNQWTTKIQLGLMVIVLLVFGVEANLSKVIGMEKCVLIGNKTICKAPTYIEKLEFATQQTTNFVKTIFSLFEKQNNLP